MKPHSMSIKEWLIKKLSLKILVPEKIINVVITDQFDQANEALKNNAQVEISGFGKYIFNVKRAEKRMATYLDQKEDIMEKLKNPNLKELVRNNLDAKLEMLLINEKILKAKLNETK